jgi:hypothetical protein
VPRVSDESLRVNLAQTRVSIALTELQAEHQLTDAEMLQAVAMWQAGLLKWAIRAERLEDLDHKVEHADYRRALRGG